MHFLKALYWTKSEISVLRPYFGGYLRYLAQEITTSQHMRRNEYSRKMSVLFYLKAEKAENLPVWFSDL